MDMDEALDLSVVVPVYNKIDNVVPLIERVRATLDAGFKHARGRVSIR